MAAPVAGFIGLGQMGKHMARNLLNKGYKVFVNDVSEEALKQLLGHGAIAAKTPSLLAEMCADSSAKAIVSMLPEGSHVKEVYLGSDGILKSVAQNTLLLDCSTIDVKDCKLVEAEANQKATTFMDCPVSGGVLAADAATLTFMVGGDKFEEAKEILQHMGQRFFHCGPIGSGQAAKICNNMMLAISMIGASETFNLGIRLGLDKNVLYEIFCTSTSRCWSIDTYNPVPGIKTGVPSDRDYEGGFGTKLMTKDLGLAQNAATESKSPTPLGSLSHQLYRALCSHGYGHKDFSVIYEFLSKQK